MEKDRNFKIIAIFALIFSIAGISIGFAAYAKNLNINIEGNVSASSSFNVQFSDSASALTTYPKSISADESSTGTGSGAEITAATTIDNIKANFTGTGQIVVYKFYVVNASDYIAYLKSIKFSKSAPTCVATAENGATQSIAEVCNNMTMNISIGDNSANYTTPNISSVQGYQIDSNNSIAKAVGETYTSALVTLTLTYTGSVVADGGIDVDYGSINLNYSTANAN